MLRTARAATGSGQPLYTRPASATTLGARWAPIPSILRNSAEVRCVIEHPLPISAQGSSRTSQNNMKSCPSRPVPYLADSKMWKQEFLFLPIHHFLGGDTKYRIGPPSTMLHLYVNIAPWPMSASRFPVRMHSSRSSLSCRARNAESFCVSEVLGII